MASRTSLVFPICLITLGVGWLMSAVGVMPSIDWLWSGGLATGGMLVMAIGGIDKATVVAGPMLIVTSMMSYLRQIERVTFEIEMPILVIVLGVLLVVSQSVVVKKPAWLLEPKPDAIER